MAAHQAPPSLGFSRQEHWSGLPFPSPMHESEKWNWSRSVVSDSFRPHGLQPTRLLRPWDFPGKSTRVGCKLRGVTSLKAPFWSAMGLKLGLCRNYLTSWEHFLNQLHACEYKYVLFQRNQTLAFLYIIYKVWETTNDEARYLFSNSLQHIHP